MLLRQKGSQSEAAERPGRLSGQNRHVGVGLICIPGDMHEDLKAYGFATTLNREAGPAVVHLAVHVEFHAEVLSRNLLPARKRSCSRFRSDWFDRGGLLLPNYIPPVSNDWIRRLSQQHPSH